MTRREEVDRSTSSGVRIHYEIPAQLHRRAKAEAALRGMTLKGFLIEVLEQAVVDQPSVPDRIKSRKNR